MFKVGEKVVCVDILNGDISLTKGKVYEIKEAPLKNMFNIYAFVTGDNGGTFLYSNVFFVSLREARKMKIKRLS